MTYLQSHLDNIQNLINHNQAEEAYCEFFKLIQALEKEHNKDLPFLYYEFGLLLFDNHYYEDCIIMLDKAYKQNYMKEEIKGFIFDCFILPNIEEFQESYTNNFNKFASNNTGLTNISYSDLKLEFIPVSENKYYIYDLEKDSFNEFIDLTPQTLHSKKDITSNNDFSDLLLLDNYNLSNLTPYAYIFKDKKIYYLSLNIEKSLSFLKLPTIFEKYLSNIIIFESIDALKNYFRENVNTYLPKIITNLAAPKYYEPLINKIIHEEHQFRISSHLNDKCNILLSICIPTWNRGHRALKALSSLLSLNYDSEIEFVVSNNGSDINTEGYEEIKKIKDSRLSYFEFDSNQGYLKNVCKVLDLAKGRFALLVSDEDSIDSYGLSYYMNMLRKNNKLGVLRTRTPKNYSHINDTYIAAGDNAFQYFFLSNNYISGVIYNKELIEKFQLTKYLTGKSNNLACSLYVHMWIDALLTFRGDFCQASTILCIEGSAEKTIRDGNRNIDKKLASYTHYESRIEQHIGFIELINQLPIKELATVTKAYLTLCYKTYFLTNIVKDTYIELGYDWNEICHELYNCCMDGMYKLAIPINYEVENIIQEYIKQEHENYTI